MNWYLAKIIFQIICGKGEHTPQFDEQLRLISAGDEDEALQKAKSLGEREQETFLNAHGKVVKWKFIDVAELIRLSTMVDGAEVYSHIQECDAPDLYLDMVQQKAARLNDVESKKLLHLL